MHYYWLNNTLGEFLKDNELFITKDLQPEQILGTKFLRKYNACIDFSNDKVSFITSNNEEIAIQPLSSADITDEELHKANRDEYYPREIDPEFQELVESYKL